MIEQEMYRDGSEESQLNGWGGRIRTYECWNQNPESYHLTTPHQGLPMPHTGKGLKVAIRPISVKRNT